MTWPGVETSGCVAYDLTCTHKWMYNTSLYNPHVYMDPNELINDIFNSYYSPLKMIFD